MENISKFRPIVFEEGFYPIGDVIKKISDSFSISFEGKAGKTARKTIYTRLWRELESMKLTDPKHVRKVSTRRTEYSHRIWNSILNKLYPWLCETTVNMEYKEFKEWKDRAKDYGRRYEKIMANADQISTMEKSSSFSVADAVEVEFQKRRLEIALDFIFSHCIELDEIMLRTDIENDLCLDEAAPSAYDLLVNERLQNNNNYYTIKEDS